MPHSSVLGCPVFNELTPSSDAVGTSEYILNTHRRCQQVLPAPRCGRSGVRRQGPATGEPQGRELLEINP